MPIPIKRSNHLRHKDGGTDPNYRKAMPLKILSEICTRYTVQCLYYYMVMQIKRTAHKAC